ncbi:MAG: hypothetical protein ACP6KW_04230 [Candidatus Thorarchaeota archaeon]
MTTEDTRDRDSEEMELFEGKSDTKLYALGVVLAAVYGMSALVPVSGFIVASGVVAQISLTIMIAPLFGVLLGPVKGGLFGLIGGLITAFLSMVVPSVVLIVPTVVLGPMVSGFLTGLCLNEEDGLPGGLITAAYLVLIMVLYLIPNSTAWWFMLPYALAAITALALQFTGFRFDRTEKKSLLYILPLTLIGTITDFSMMTMGAVYIAGIPAEVFGFVIFPAMLVERTVAAIVSAVAAGTVLYTFRDQLW